MTGPDTSETLRTLAWRTAVIAALLPWAAGAQAPRQGPLVFRSSTQLVQINVIVDGKQGPVGGLSAGDFQITDNGKPRTVRVFSFDDERGEAVPVAPSGAAGAAGAAAPQAPTGFSNAHPRAPGMVVVLFDALDSPDGTECVTDGRRPPVPVFTSSHSFALAKRGALRFLAQLDPRAHVALYGLDTRLRVLADFTNSRGQLVAALRAYRPSTATFAGSGDEAFGVPGAFSALNAQADADFQRDVVDAQARASAAPALAAIAHHLAGLPGRISLVWMLTRPPLPGPVVEAAVANTNIAVYPVDMRGLMPREFVYAQGLAPACGIVTKGALLNRLNVQPAGTAEMDDIANATGGRALVNSNDFGRALAAAVADSEASYTLGFYLEAAELDNQFHRLTVSVRGKRLEVRYPHGYWALRGTAADGPPPEAALQAALDVGLASPLDASALTLQARIEPVGGGVNAVRVTGTLGIAALRLSDIRGRRQGSVILATVVQNAAGTVLERSQGRLRLQYTQAEFERALRSGVQFEQMVALPPGAATLRLLAEDAATGAVGSLIVPLAAARE